MSEAYQILSDATLRERYDKYGIMEGISPEGGFMNAEMYFKQMFGGEKFEPIIGDLALGKLLGEYADQQANEAQQKADDAQKKADAPDASTSGSSSAVHKREANNDVMSKERMAEHRVQQLARVKKLVDNLISKTEPFVTLHEGEAVFRSRMEKEAKELKEESYGPALLAAVGYMYETKGQNYLAKDGWFGVKGVIGSLKEKGHLISSVFETVGAMRDADPATRSKKRAAQTPSTDPQTGKLHDCIVA